MDAAEGRGGHDGGLHGVAVATLSRDELEDRYLRLRDTHQELKKVNRKQEEKMKRMATKLLRLTADFKKAQSGQVHRRDLETEEMIEEMQSRIRDLERKNEGLNKKLLVAKQQVDVRQSARGPYSRVQARINSGISRPPPAPVQDGGKKTFAVHASPPPQPRYGHSLLEEERAKTAHLEQVIADLESELNEEQERRHQESVQFEEQLKLENAGHQEEIAQFKQQVIILQRANAEEEVNLMKLQRDLKEKSVRMENLKTQYLTAEQQVEKLKVSHSHLLEELAQVQQQLQQEQTRSNALLANTAASKMTDHTVTELQEMITDLRSEKELLQQANQRLVSSAFDEEQERQHKAQLYLLQERLELCETDKKQRLVEKSQLLEQLQREKEQLSKVQREQQQQQAMYYELKHAHDEMATKMKFFSRESSVDFAELEEALALIKVRKAQGKNHLDWLQSADSSREDREQASREKEVEHLRASHAETVQELEKTRHLLTLQHSIAQDLEKELERLRQKLSECQREGQLQLKEYADLLDRRAAKIKKLEGQLHDLAYSTKQFPVKAELTGEDALLEETLDLEPGHNLLEVHFGQLELSHAAMESLQDTNPTLFVSHDFFDFETEISPALVGLRLDFNFTSEFVVVVDDFFLHYLQRSSSCVELYQAFGVQCQLLATGKMWLKDLVLQEKTTTRLHGRLTLSGVEEHTGAVFGYLEFWARLRCPAEQALRLYRERTKALGYVASNQLSGLAPSSAGTESTSLGSDGVTPMHVNELAVTIVSCSGVMGRTKDEQPSVYVVYKFFDTADHCTTTVVSSNTPQFNDTHIVLLPVSAELDQYLQTEVLQVFVFDEKDTEFTAYLGMASIVLLPLARNKSIKQTVPLRTVSGDENGAIIVELSWRNPYMATAIESPEASPRGEKVVASRHTLSSSTLAVSELNVESPKEDVTGSDTLTVSQLNQPLAQQANTSLTDDEEEEEDVAEVDIAKQEMAKVGTLSEDSWNSSPSHPETDENELVISPAPRTQTGDAVPSITITVGSLSLLPTSSIYNDPSIQQIFISYQFLGCALDELETPSSLPKPTPGTASHFGFHKVFHMDREKFPERCEWLVSFMSSTSPEQGQLQFTIVSEPTQPDSTADCVDVACAVVDCHQIAARKQDLHQQNVKVVSISEPETVGHLTLTVEILSALQHLGLASS